MKFEPGEVHVTPMDAHTRVFMQREAERRKNDPPEQDICVHCGMRSIDFEVSHNLCYNCNEYRILAQMNDAADRARDERWADQWEEMHE